MTTDITPAVNNSQATAFMQSLSPDQLRILMGAVAPQASTTDALATVVESLADRLAGNGLTSDMAGHWANQLESFLTDETEDATKTVVGGAVNFLRRAGHVTAADATRLEGDLRGFVDEHRETPQTTIHDVGNVIDTTARPVQRPSTNYQSQGTSGQVPAFPTPSSQTTHAEPPELNAGQMSNESL